MYALYIVDGVQPLTVWDLVIFRYFILLLGVTLTPTVVTSTATVMTTGNTWLTLTSFSELCMCYYNIYLKYYGHNTVD